MPRRNATGATMQWIGSKSARSRPADVCRLLARSKRADANLCMRLHSLRGGAERGAVIYEVRRANRRTGRIRLHTATYQACQKSESVPPRMPSSTTTTLSAHA
jgi:hypothetical protein